MIHEEIATFEVAKLAKEKGFREKCIEHYYDDTKDLYRSSNPQCYNFGGNTSDAPTQSLLQRWLREEKGVVIDVVLDWQYNIEAEEIRYQYRIGCKHRMTIEDIQTRGIVRDRYFATYELALEDAELYCLKNLL